MKIIKRFCCIIRPSAKAVAERCDMPLKKILNMPVGTNWIFRRGQAPVNAKNIDLDEYLMELYADDSKDFDFFEQWMN